MSKLKLLSLLTFSLLFCDDNEGYVFELNLTNDFYLNMESVVNISAGSFEYQQLFSARMLHEFEKPNTSSGEMKMIQSFENVISSDRRNDEMKPNHEAQKLTGTSYTITIDSLGKVESTEGNSDLAKQVLDESEEVNWLFGVNRERNNIKYFMGEGLRRNVGDVWSISDTTLNPPTTYGFDKFNGTVITYSDYSFKKIKKKRGDVIAVVKSKTGIQVKGIGSTWDQTVDFSQVGEFICTITFNITKGLIVSNRIDGTMNILGKDLEDDSSFSAAIDVALKQKGKLK